MGIRAIRRVQLFPPPGAAAPAAARAAPCPPCRRGDARALPPLRGSAGAPRAAPPAPLRSKPVPEGEGTAGPPSAAPQGGSRERSGRPSGDPRPLFPASLAGSRGRPSCWGREGAATGPPGAAHLGGLPGPRGAGAGQAAELATPGKCRGPTRGPGACGCSCSGVSSPPGYRGPPSSVVRMQAEGNGTSPTWCLSGHPSRSRAASPAKRALCGGDPIHRRGPGSPCQVPHCQ